VKIIIDIPDVIYEHATRGFLEVFDIRDIRVAIMKGTPLPKGKWIPITNKNGTKIATRCSSCGNPPKHAIESDFCPNCGARMKMVEPQESEDKE